MDDNTTQATPMPPPIAPPPLTDPSQPPPVLNMPGGPGDRYRKEFRKIMDSNEAYRGAWNWDAFLFGPLWCLARGCWICAFVIILFVFVFNIRGHPVPACIGAALFTGYRGTWIYYNVRVKSLHIPQPLI